MSSEQYNKDFYSTQRTGSAQSAALIVPWIVETFKPRRVIDVGCGVGTWAAEFLRCEVPYVLGVDGGYVDQSELAIPKENFRAVDLEVVTLEDINQTFDLSICLEVAEHLTPARAKPFIELVTSLSPIAIFGAAIPRQGGTNHLNEQWQSYWAELFADHNFVSFDIIRPKFWQENVESWYLQNTLVYISTAKADKYKLPRPSIMNVIHPNLYFAHVKAAAKLQQYASELEQKLADCSSGANTAG